MKRLVQDHAPREMTVSLHEEWASVLPFGALDQRTDFTRGRIAIEMVDARSWRSGPTRGRRSWDTR